MVCINSFAILLTFVVAGVFSTQCGTAMLNMTCLERSDDYLAPINSPCTAVGCDGPSGNEPGHLPWNVYFNFCKGVGRVISGTPNCNGSAACQTWPGQPGGPMVVASLGALDTCKWTMGASKQEVIYSCTNGTKAVPIGGVKAVPRQFTVKVICPLDENNDKYPRFIYEDTSTLHYAFEFKHTAACGSCTATASPTPSPTPTTTPSPTTTGVSIGMLVACSVAACLFGVVLTGVTVWIVSNRRRSYQAIQ